MMNIIGKIIVLLFLLPIFGHADYTLFKIEHHESLTLFKAFSYSGVSSELGGLIGEESKQVYEELNAHLTSTGRINDKIKLRLVSCSKGVEGHTHIDNLYRKSSRIIYDKVKQLTNGQNNYFLVKNGTVYMAQAISQFAPDLLLTPDKIDIESKKRYSHLTLY